MGESQQSQLVSRSYTQCYQRTELEDVVGGRGCLEEPLLKRESAGVSAQSLARWCTLLQVAHTWRRGHKEGKEHWPKFHDKQTCDDLDTGRTTVSWWVGCCRNDKAHCAWLWSNPWHIVQQSPALDGRWPRTVEASRGVWMVFQGTEGSSAACCRKRRS